MEEAQRQDPVPLEYHVDGGNGLFEHHDHTAGTVFLQGSLHHLPHHARAVLTAYQGEIRPVETLPVLHQGIDGRSRTQRSFQRVVNSGARFVGAALQGEVYLAG